MAFQINNRRYTGNKHKLIPEIRELILSNCKNCNSFFDVFAGTGVVTAGLIDSFSTFIINDFLYSNEVIFRAFFEKEDYDLMKIVKISQEFNSLDSSLLRIIMFLRIMEINILSIVIH